MRGKFFAWMSVHVVERGWIISRCPDIVVPERRKLYLLAREGGFENKTSVVFGIHQCETVERANATRYVRAAQTAKASTLYKIKCKKGTQQRKASACTLQQYVDDVLDPSTALIPQQILLVPFASPAPYTPTTCTYAHNGKGK
ncbi:hypothetical protein TRVL_02487 [Trypanosoma vivax]|nr:hypothetical protein TRVL_02487 [Trypanosoma vivax]